MEPGKYKINFERKKYSFSLTQTMLNMEKGPFSIILYEMFDFVFYASKSDALLKSYF